MCLKSLKGYVGLLLKKDDAIRIFSSYKPNGRMYKKAENSPDDGQAKAKGRSASWGPSFVRFMRLGEFLALSQNCEKRLLDSSCLSLRPFVRMEQLGSHWTDFHEILYLSIFRKSVEEIQVPLKSDKNNGCTLREDLCTFMIISRWIFPRMKNVSDKMLQKIKTHILCSAPFFKKIVPFMRQRRQMTK